MGVLIVAGTLGLVVALVQKVGGGSPTAEGIALRQPAGSAIEGVSAAEGLVTIWVRRPDGDRVLLVDSKRGRVSGEIRLGE
ncbi:hypothetical protein GXW79_15435 [Roseomonas arctica]|uniref:Uncharacterized protein n=2 Tax=Plastoroseomonas arctica TaxID=1509237 RepID=A0AAF1KPT5_9PROT|nr:hypothetical protein [Plastoroseomonas arctica]MBR0656473.1 hypothetical protein [Plastoroseomonas arctica]